MTKAKYNGEWTLVQHSGYVHGSKSGFLRGVEINFVPTRSAANIIRKAGGLLFATYEAGTAAEQRVNYPAGVEGLYPQARGTFHAKYKIDDLPIYIPAAGEADELKPPKETAE